MNEGFNAATWLVDRHVEQGDGDRIAIRTASRIYSYRELQGRVQRTGGALLELGVRPEERVAMVMLDGVDFVSVFLGAMRIGAIPVPVNPLLPGRDLAVIAADARARIAVVSSERSASIADLRSGAPELSTVIRAGSEVSQADESDLTLATLLESASPAEVYPTWADSPGFWLCTSGSTGRPKLAQHTHGDIRVTSETYGRHILEIGPEDICYSVGPMFHAYGLGNSLTFPFAVGASAVLDPTRPPSPRLVADNVTAHLPTLFFCIPTFYAALNAADLPDDTFASVRWGISAAEPLPAESFLRFEERFGVKVLDGIGSTEMLHIYLSNSGTKLKPGSSGVPVPGYAVKVIDNDGNEQPSGEPGQLVASGASMAQGYWCRTELNRRTFRGEWMYTGDLYVADVDGFHTYMGRIDDMMRVGGEWVSPAEVEGTLIEHSAVLEVAVVGELDADSVVRPVAFVVPSGDSIDTDELTTFCRERLAGYKRPKRYEVVAELPKTATGKIQRFKLRSAAPHG